MITPSAETIVSVLERAKGVLLEKGWGREVMFNPETGRYCAAGAVAQAVLGHTKVVLVDEEPAATAVVGMAKHALIVTRGVHAQGWTKEFPCRHVSDHNDRCIGSMVEALDWFDRAITYAKDHYMKDVATLRGTGYSGLKES